MLLLVCAADDDDIALEGLLRLVEMEDELGDVGIRIPLLIVILFHFCDGTCTIQVAPDQLEVIQKIFWSHCLVPRGIILRFFIVLGVELINTLLGKYYWVMSSILIPAIFGSNQWQGCNISRGVLPVMGTAEAGGW